MNKVMGQNGVTAGSAPFLSKNGSVRGHVFCGMAKDELRAFANDRGCTWSIQDGQITLIQKTGYLGGRVPVISPQTGLIGVPEQTQNGISIHTLLNPRLKIGQLIQLQSTVNQARIDTMSSPAAIAGNFNLQKGAKVSGDGVYYVMIAEHTGDTRSQPWYTDLTCLAADASQIPFGLIPQLQDVREPEESSRILTVRF